MFCIYSLLRIRSTVPLPINGRICSLNYTGFRPSSREINVPTIDGLKENKDKRYFPQKLSQLFTADFIILFIGTTRQKIRCALRTVFHMRYSTFVHKNREVYKDHFNFITNCDGSMNII
jgi:hypothetical protein